MISKILIYENQVSSLEGFPLDVSFGNMTNIESIEEKERLLALWKY